MHYNYKCNLKSVSEKMPECKKTLENAPIIVYANSDMWGI